MGAGRRLSRTAQAASSSGVPQDSTSHSRATVCGSTLAKGGSKTQGNAPRRVGVGLSHAASTSPRASPSSRSTVPW